jgi:hypothetical protein
LGHFSTLGLALQVYFLLGLPKQMLLPLLRVGVKSWMAVAKMGTVAYSKGQG